jgi:hypothetical protein
VRDKRQLGSLIFLKDFGHMKVKVERLTDLTAARKGGNGERSDSGKPYRKGR